MTAGATASGAAADAGAAAALDTWQGQQEVHRAERIPRSAFVQQLDWESDAPFEGGSPVLLRRRALCSLHHPHSSAFNVDKTCLLSCLCFVCLTSCIV